MHEVYIDRTLFPVAPEKIKTKINGQNKTVTLLDGSEINLLKRSGLTDINFDLLLPNVLYPWAVYPDGFKPAKYYLDKLTNLISPPDGSGQKEKRIQTPFSLVISRNRPDGVHLWGTSLLVSLESFSIDEEASEGTDVIVSLSFKQHGTWETATYSLKPAPPKDESNNGTVSTSNKTSQQKNGNEITVGSKVKIKAGAKYYNGATVPQWATLNTYTVDAVNVSGKSDCVLLDRTGLNSIISTSYLDLISSVTAKVV